MILIRTKSVYKWFVFLTSFSSLILIWLWFRPLFGYDYVDTYLLHKIFKYVMLVVVIILASVTALIKKIIDDLEWKFAEQEIQAKKLLKGNGH